MNDIPEPTEMLSVEEIAKRINHVLKVNDVKKGSKKARTIECSFIQGMIVADPKYSRNTYLTLCLLAGRSILD
jgi:hypothetical protein